MKNLREESYHCNRCRIYLSLQNLERQFTDMIYERHQYPSCLEKLGVSAEIAEKDACKIEHVISKEL